MSSGADAGFRVRGGGGGGALRAEGRKGGWVREGASPPPTPARGYGGAL